MNLLQLKLSRDERQLIAFAARNHGGSLEYKLTNFINFRKAADSHELLLLDAEYVYKCLGTTAYILMPNAPLRDQLLKKLERLVQS